LHQDIIILLDTSESMNFQFEGTESAESKIAIIKRGLKQYFARPEGVDPELVCASFGLLALKPRRRY
jgi:hypothetical protein